MTSFSESVETIEATWRIPNFRQSAAKIPLQSDTDFHKTFFIAGRIPSAGPQSKSTSVKVDAFVTQDSPGNTAQWQVEFFVMGQPELTPFSLIRMKFLEFNIVDKDAVNVVKGLLRGGRPVEKEFRSKSEMRHVKLFDVSEAQSHLDSFDGSLNIHFKVEVTCNCPNPTVPTAPNTGDFSELSDTFESLLKDPLNADVEIQVSLGAGQTFRCHKGILAVRSPVFRAMFSSGMKETEGSVVEVDDILPKTMEHFLSFLYCGRFQDSSWMLSLPQLAYASDKYCVGPLKDICDSHLIRSVTTRNALALGKLAERHGLTKAAEDIRKFIVLNSKKVTLDTEEEISDANFKLCYSIPNCSTQIDTETLEIISDTHPTRPGLRI